MENRDFRDRLKNHKREVDPAAWDQMEGLLDSLPITKEEDKRKKRGFWLFFFGIGIISLIGVTWLKMYPLGTAESNNQLSNQSTIELNIPSESETTTEYNMTEDQNSDLSSTDVKHTNENILENKVQQQAKKRALNSDSKLYTIPSNQEQSPAEHDNKDHKTVHEIDNGKVDKGRIEKSEITDMSNSENLDVVDKDVSGSNVSKLNTSSTSNENSKENSLKEASPDLMNLKVGDVENKSVLLEVKTDVSTSKEEDEEKNRDDLFNLEKLLLPLASIVSNEGLEDIQSPSIQIVKPSLFSYFLGGGYAAFNGNPGYIIQTGTYYELDRILDLEANLSYSYGSEQNIPQGELFTYERQFDMSLIFHLNMIKNRSHKLSFIAGVGYTMYGGQRIIRSEPIIVDDRRHNGRSLQLGFDYQFKVNKRSALGFRVGAIVYDDAVTYFAPRYIHKF